MARPLPRRTLLVTLAASGAALATRAQAQAALDEKDAQAAALGYVADAKRAVNASADHAAIRCHHTQLRIAADVSDATQPLPSGATREPLLARFHVRVADGRLLSGAAAFIALWESLPGSRWLACIGRLPGAAWVMERTYRLFLRGRPMLQRWAARLDAAR